MINPKLYKELIRQYFDIPNPEFMVVLASNRVVIDRFFGGKK